MNNYENTKARMKMILILCQVPLWRMSLAIRYLIGKCLSKNYLLEFKMKETANRIKIISLNLCKLMMHQYHLLEKVDTTLAKFCEFLDEFCGRAEIVTYDRDESEWLALPLTDLRVLVNEIMSIRSKKLLHLVSLVNLTRLLRVLDHQIHRAEQECQRVLQYASMPSKTYMILNFSLVPLIVENNFG